MNITILRVFSLSFLFIVSFGASLLSAAECNRLTATGNSEYPPYLWRQSKESEKLVGAIDFIMSEVSKRLNRDIELKHVGSWSRAQEEVKSGRVDMIAGAFYTVPRNQWMDYVYPAFLETNSVVWKNKKTAVYQEMTDLIGELGVTVINNSFGQEFDEFSRNHLKIESVASLEQAFKMLVLERVDYALYERNPGLAFANKLGVMNEIQPMSPPISSEGLYLTISHNSKCNTGKLRGELAKVIRELSIEGFNQEALKRGLALRKKSLQRSP
jgi:polar amino acid transport system substrate-binding protein